MAPAVALPVRSGCFSVPKISPQESGLLSNKLKINSGLPEV